MPGYIHSFILAAGALIVYAVVIVIYRLYFSPLAKIPGPKIAGATSLYNAYYDLVRGGQYIWAVEDMHRKYGPIVRTRPDTVHVNDPAFIDKLYTQSPKYRRERYYTILQTLQTPGSILATQDHDMHRRRRAVLNPYFSHRNVRRLEPLINSTLADLLGRMEGWAKDSTPVNLNRPFRAATKDVVQAYCFGEGEKCLEMEDCNAAFFDVMTPQRIVHLGTHVYWLAQILANLPTVVATTLLPRVGVFMTFVEELIQQVEEVRKAKEVPEGKTIFHDIIRGDIPASEKETKRLVDEAVVLVIAGSETTASTLAALVYHVLADPQSLKRLKSELAAAIPDAKALPVAAELDQLPYLNALIEEALRLYPGATHRQDRLCPDEDLVYDTTDGKAFTIPAGTGIGMTAPLVNRYPSLYADPDSFQPDRYIKDPSLSKHLFTFSKGTRQCIGMNLAYQELQTFTAGIFRRYDLYDPSLNEQKGPTLELFETGQADIATHAEYITPAQYEGSLGLRVIIRH